MKKILLRTALVLAIASALTAVIFIGKSSDSNHTDAPTTAESASATDSLTAQAVTVTTTAPTTADVPSAHTAASTTAAKTTAPPPTEKSEPVTSAATTEAKKTTTTAPSTTKAETAKLISAQIAEEIALSHAGFKASEVYDKEVELDRKNGKQVYEVSFEKDRTEYDYIIDAKGGVILSSKKDIRSATASAWDTKPTENNPDNKISREEALDIALRHAGFSASDVRKKEVEAGREKGIWVYDVSFEKDNIEYEYVINSQSGEIIRSEIDRNQ